MALLEVHWNGTFPRTYSLSWCEHNIYHSLAVALKACHNANQHGYMKVVKRKRRSGKLFPPRWQSFEGISKQVAIKRKYVACLPAFQGEVCRASRLARHSSPGKRFPRRFTIGSWQSAWYQAPTASLSADLLSLWKMLRRPLGTITPTECQGGLITISMVSWAASWDSARVASTTWKSSHWSRK